jgi:uncharacterized phage protein (TIGR01671 family)
MNREIKFRAWDGNNMIGFDSVKYLVEFDGTIWENEGEYEHDRLMERPTFTLMQFTGLRDKNDKEVYEGDIVTMLSYNYQHMNNYKWEVRYNPEGMMFKFYYSDGKKECYEDIYGWHSFEIIGNVYENPELLK